VRLSGTLPARQIDRLQRMAIDAFMHVRVDLDVSVAHVSAAYRHPLLKAMVACLEARAQATGEEGETARLALARLPAFVHQAGFAHEEG
jgi:hypothetical protein